jgi:hypothetical protein
MAWNEGRSERASSVLRLGWIGCCAPVDRSVPWSPKAVKVPLAPFGSGGESRGGGHGPVGVADAVPVGRARHQVVQARVVEVPGIAGILRGPRGHPVITEFDERVAHRLRVIQLTVISRAASAPKVRCTCDTGASAAYAGRCHNHGPAATTAPAKVLRRRNSRRDTYGRC